MPVLVVRDRSGATADFKLSGTDTDAMEPPLCAILAKDVILCSDGAAVYRAVASKLGVPHRPVNLTAGIRVIAGVYHIQNVNAYDSWLKLWMERFHGVATKYLENYLGWRRWLERWGEHNSPQHRSAGRARSRKSISTINADIKGDDLFGPRAQVVGAGVSAAGRPRLPIRLMASLLYLTEARI